MSDAPPVLGSKAEGETSRLDKYSKENRWYIKSLDGHLEPSSRLILEEYSHIPPEDIDAHIYKTRDILWSSAPYPCIGEFKFLTPWLPLHPSYAKIMSLLRQSPSSSGPLLISTQEAAIGPLILDLGCCVAQELRSLAHAGIPSTHLYGSDLQALFLKTSYTLFNDAATFKGKLIPANIFSPTLFSGAFQGLENKFAVVHAGLFLHLFSWEQQLIVCARVVRLLNKEKGSMFVGEMVGCRGGGERGSGEAAAKLWEEGEERKQFLHDESSLERMWSEVARMTGTEGSWKVEAHFKLRRDKGEDAGKRFWFFNEEGVGWLTFCVERV